MAPPADISYEQKFDNAVDWADEHAGRVESQVRGSAEKIIKAAASQVGSMANFVKPNDDSSTSGVVGPVRKTAAYYAQRVADGLDTSANYIKPEELNREPIKAAGALAYSSATSAVRLAKSAGGMAVSIIPGVNVVGNPRYGDNELGEAVETKVNEIADQVADGYAEVKEQNPQIQQAHNAVVDGVDTAKQYANHALASADEKAAEAEQKAEDVVSRAKDELQSNANAFEETAQEAADDTDAGGKNTVERVKENIQEQAAQANEELESLSSDLSSEAEEKQNEVQDALQEAKEHAMNTADEVAERGKEAKQEVSDDAKHHHKGFKAKLKGAKNKVKKAMSPSKTATTA